METIDKKRKVLLVNNSVYLPGEGGYKRTMYMFDMMRRMGYKVTLITSDFNHYNKKTRDIEAFRREYPDYGDIQFLHMPPYKKNISVKRYFAEKYWSLEFKKWMKAHAHEYDVVFFSDIDYNLPVDKICNKHNVKKIVDIRDLRPEAFRVVVKNELLYRILFFPMTIKANMAYACADELVAVSQEYLDRGLSANKKSKNPLVVYLGSTMERFYDGAEKFAQEFEKKPDEVWVTYAGTLGESYDLQTLILAAKKLLDRRGAQVRFKILGQGPDAEKLKAFALSVHADNVEFLGFLPYEKMAAVLCKSDIAINAVKKSASQSIINKVGDYFAAGIPMLNSCTCREQQEMVTKYNVGLNYEAENHQALVEKIEQLLDNPSLREEMGRNARELAKEKFDRKTSYLEIIRAIDEV